MIAEASTPADPSTQTPAPTGVNSTLIVGELVTEPEVRTLPGGTELLSFSLTVRQPNQATTSVPFVWYDPPARSHRFKLGARLVVSGRVVRRFYRTGAGTGSRTEVAVRVAEPLTADKASASLVVDHLDRLHSLLTAAGRGP